MERDHVEETGNPLHRYRTPQPHLSDHRSRQVRPGRGLMHMAGKALRHSPQQVPRVFVHPVGKRMKPHNHTALCCPQRLQACCARIRHRGQCSFRGGRQALQPCLWQRLRPTCNSLIVGSMNPIMTGLLQQVCLLLRNSLQDTRQRMCQRCLESAQAMQATCQRRLC